MILLTKLNNPEDRLWYAERAATEGWSRKVLEHHIATDLKGRQGLAPSNFDRTLPPADSDMAKEMLTDPLDASFVAGEAAASERDLEPELIAMYWRIGKMILDRQEAEGWGAKVIEQLWPPISRRRAPRASQSEISATCELSLRPGRSPIPRGRQICRQCLQKSPGPSTRCS